MTDIHLSEFMELDSYWENAVKDAAENTIHSQRRLELALRNRKKINKLLQNCGYKPVLMEMMRNGRGSNGKEDDSMDVDEDDDEVLTVNSWDEDDPRPESINEVDHESNTQSGPSARRKAQLTLPKKNYVKENTRSCFRDKTGPKIKKLNVEFAREPLHERHEDEEKTSGHYSRMNPYVLRKKRLAVLTAQIKRKKRNANMRKQEKKTKNMKMKGKSYKTKRARKKMSQGSDNGGKQDEKSKNQETKADSSNVNETNGKVNNEDGNKSSTAGKEVPVTKKVSQNGGKNASNAANPPAGPKTDKDHSKGDCSQDANPKEKDISKYGDVCKEMALVCGIRGPLRLYTLKRLKRNCGGPRTRKHKQSRRGKKRIGPFIKFYMTVYKELCGTCSIRSIAKVAGERWKCMSRKEKLKYYPRKYKKQTKTK